MASFLIKIILIPQLFQVSNQFTQSAVSILLKARHVGLSSSCLELHQPFSQGMTMLLSLHVVLEVKPGARKEEEEEAGREDKEEEKKEEEGREEEERKKGEGGKEREKEGERRGKKKKGWEEGRKVMPGSTETPRNN
jgi:hypothetical protein